jgi:adenosylcobinamide-GDP ribazoletransferase
VLTLLLQVACLATLLTRDAGWAACWIAVVAARLAMARTGLPGVPTAEGSSLGRAVAGTVSVRWLAVSALVLAVAVVAVTGADPALTARLLGSATAGLLAAEVVLRRARRRLGGVSGDVMGAMGETATAAALLAAAVVVG